MAHCRGQCQLCLPFALQVSSQKTELYYSGIKVKIFSFAILSQIQKGRTKFPLKESPACKKCIWNKLF